MKRKNSQPMARLAARKKSVQLAASMLLLSSCSPAPDARGPGEAHLPPAPASIGQHRAALAGQDGDFTVTAAQTILNTYTTLGVALAKGDSVLTVTDATVLTDPMGMPLKKNDLILIYQAQGATIDTTDDAKKYGKVQALNGAGRFEFVNVADVTGNKITIATACKGVQNDYPLPGRTQVVRVAQFNNLTINPGASVVAKTWDGKVGGIVAVHVLHDTQLGGTIDVTARGFSGGKIDPNSNAGLTMKVATAVTKDETMGAVKGESIAGSQADYMAGAGHIGRGAPANGGGGGNAFKTGGGGGAGGGDLTMWTGHGVMDKMVTGGSMAWALDQAYKDNGNMYTSSTGGGRGGYSFSRPMGMAPDPTVDPPNDAKWGIYQRSDVGGLGGHPLQPVPGFELFMGGGGGAGDQADSSGGSGGNGGGVVILMSNTVTVPTGGVGLIKATGGGGQDTGNGYNDGAGGGGGGGSIFVLSGKPLDKSVILSADGGRAGSQRSEPSDPQEAEGPGGGGGGGVIVYMAGGAPTTSVKGQAGGTTVATTLMKFPSNGATAGFDGLTVMAPRQPVIAGMPGSYPICLPADIQVTVAPPPGMVQPGGKADYKVTVKNNGENPALGADITSQYPPGVDPAQVTWTCAPMGAGVMCPGNMTSGTGPLPAQADLPPGGSLSFTVSLPVPKMSPNPTLDLVVSAYPPPGYTDPDLTNNKGTGKAPITSVVVKPPVSDLEVTVSKSPTTPNPGDEVTVTINAKNNGPDGAGKPVAIFTIPPGSTVTQAPPMGDPMAPWDCTANGTTYTCTLKMDLPPGTQAPPLVVKFKTPPDMGGPPTGTPQVVVVVGSPGSVDPKPTNNSATVDVGPTKPAPTADLALTVTKTPVTNGPGMETAFSLQPQNLGPSRAPNPYLTFTVPTGSVFTQEPTGTGWSCLRSGFTVTCLAPQLLLGMPAQPVAIRIIAPQTTPPNTTPGSVAGVIGCSQVTDPNPLNNADSKPIAAATTPTGSDLQIRITVDKPNPLPGDEVTYTGMASNGGPDPVANPAVVINLPPGAVVIQPAQGEGWSCTQTGSTAICTRDTIPVGEAPPITVKVKLPTGSGPKTGVPTTTAVVGAPNNNDPNLSNNTAVVDTRPSQPGTGADLALAITKTPPMGTTGMEVTYTVQATNRGPETVKSPSVTFSVPAGSKVTQPAQGQGWDCLQSGYSFTCYLAGDLSVGEAAPITVKLNTPAPADPNKSPGAVAGVVSAPSNKDPNLLNNVAAVEVGNKAPTGSDLEIKISSSPQGPGAGDVVTYKADTSNKGPDAVKDPVVTINLPPGAEVVEEPHGDGWSCTRAANSVLCTRESVPTGSAPPIVVKVKLPQQGTINSTATATVSAANNNDPVLANNVALSDLYRLVGGGLGCSLGGNGQQGSAGLLLLSAGLAIILGLSSRRRRYAAAA